MQFAVIAHQASETNVALAARGWQGATSHLLAPRLALLKLDNGDVALNRLDVSPLLDGVEEGLWIINQLEAQGVRVFNRPSALLAAHDKLITARLLSTAGLPHPRSRRLVPGVTPAGLAFPVVAKPRFGSWGRDVEICADPRALQAYVDRMRTRPWWRAGGIVQELVPPRSNDLRIIVSGRDVVGAAVRFAGSGEWRTNVALGGRSIATTPPADACDLALAATMCLGLDVAGVDLLRDEEGWVVVEVNGAVDMKSHYALTGDVFAAVLNGLRRTEDKPLLASQW